MLDALGPLLYPLALLVGVVAGTLGSLIGAGGGVIIVPLLTMFAHSFSAAEVTAVSLVAVGMNSGSATYSNWRDRLLYHKAILPLLALSVPGSVLGVWLSHQVTRGQFGTLVAAILVTLAGLVLVRHIIETRRERTVQRATALRRHPPVRNALFVPLGAVVGTVTTTMGIGGGTMYMPFMLGVCKFPLRLATATTMAVLLASAVAATIAHAVLGDLTGHVSLALTIGVGALIGAQITHRYLRGTHPTVVVRVLVLVLLFSALRALLP